MKVLLIGATGFIGKNIVYHLLDAGYSVSALCRREIKFKNVECLLIPALTPENIEQALDGKIFDAIINLAAAGVNPTNRDTSELININCMLPAFIISLAKKISARAVIIAGSASEYQNQSIHELYTEQSPLETKKLYGATKAAGGILALAKGNYFEIPTVVTRLFNIFGPREASHRLLPCLVKNLEMNQSVFLSDGNQVRDFVYIDDACSGIIATMTALLENRLKSGVYNIATGFGNSVINFCKTTAKLLKADETLLKFGALQRRKDDDDYIVGNASLLEKKIAWKAYYNMEEGLQKAIEFYKRNKET